jgi:hypothetical protein
MLYPHMPRFMLGSRRRGLIICALCLPAGCAEIESEPDLGVAPLVCPDFGCNSNSPLVAGIKFHELSMRGEFNPEGLALGDLIVGDERYTVSVDRDRLRGVDAHGHEVVSDGQLAGSFIELLDEDGQTYYVEITNVTDELTFWVGPLDIIQTYRLEWRDELDTATRGPVCPDLAESIDWGNAADHEAIFFTGDRYNAATKEVTAIGEKAEGWFNVACAGSATAKMHTTRHTTPGSTLGFRATRLQRQAMLKMWVSDYCGIGQSFTEIGEPLRWRNRMDWKLLGLSAPIQFESVWTSEGAICLDTPRIGDNAAEMGATLADIFGTCGFIPPPCTGNVWFPGGWKTMGYVLTANP